MKRRRMWVLLTAAVLAISGVTAVTNGAEATAPVLTWGAPTPIDAPATPAGVSCAPASSFCLEVDTAGYAYGYNPTGPANTQYRLVGALVDTSAAFTAVSCPSATACVLTDSGGGAYIYAGTTLTARAIIDPGQNIKSISCPTTTFCVALDSTGAVVGTNNHWAAHQAIASTTLAAVSCVSSTFCVAVDGAGFAYTYNGTTWSAATPIDTQGPLRAISCVSTSFCLAVDGVGNTLFRHASTWSAPKNIAGGNGLNSVSCTSTTFCVAVSQNDAGLVYNGTTWTGKAHLLGHVFGAPPAIDEPVMAVSCASTTLCIAIDQTQDYSAYDGTAWGTTYTNYRAVNVVASCPTSTQCAAVDTNYGWVMLYANGAWTAPHYIAGTTLVDGVTCVSATFCVFSTATGVSIFNGTSLTTPFSLSDLVVSVSCSSATFCMALTRYGKASRWNGTKWSTPIAINGTGPTGSSGISVSCTGKTFCMETDLYDQTNVWNGTAWSGPSASISTLPIPQVSCSSPKFCVAVQFDKSVLEYDGIGWTSYPVDKVGPVFSVSCVLGVRVCFAADSSNGFLAITGKVGTRTTPGVLGGLDCPTTSFCVSYGSFGVRMGQAAA